MVDYFRIARNPRTAAIKGHLDVASAIEPQNLPPL